MLRKGPDQFFVRMKSDLAVCVLCIIKTFPLYKYHTEFEITTSNCLMVDIEEVEDERAVFGDQHL